MQLILGQRASLLGGSVNDRFDRMEVCCSVRRVKVGHEKHFCVDQLFLNQEAVTVWTERSILRSECKLCVLIDTLLLIRPVYAHKDEVYNWHSACILDYGGWSDCSNYFSETVTPNSMCFSEWETMCVFVCSRWQGGKQTNNFVLTY